MNEIEIREKAINRYEADCQREGALFQQPSDVDYNSSAKTVTLSNVRGELAKYYFTERGLRRLD